MPNMISKKTFRRFVVTIAGAGLIGAAAGLVASQVVPEKWGAEAVVLLARASSTAVDPSPLVLERLRSTSFLTTALERKGLGHVVRSLDANGGGQLTVSLVRQTDAVRIRAQDRTAQGASEIVTAIFDALKDDLVKNLVRNRQLFVEQQKALVATAEQLRQVADQVSVASDLVEVMRDMRSMDSLLENIEPTRLLAPVSVGFRPDFPKPSYFALAGLIAGLTLGYILAVGRRLLGLRDA